MPNNDFICDCCGQPEMCLSTITLTANYGSMYDGEKYTLYLCPSCFDSFCQTGGFFCEDNQD